MNFNLVFGLFLIITLWSADAKCAFRINETIFPEKTSRDPFNISGMEMCKEYNGQLGCCDSGNNFQQSASYGQIDGVFGHLGGGCDICAINLKRFYCEYACSPRQSEFLKIGDGYYEVPSPQNPSKTLWVQRVDITVSAQTACKLYESCKRNPFVSSVSAMSTPAGFLTFQGQNAPDNSNQQIFFTFSYNNNESLSLTDENQQQSSKSLSYCNLTTNETTVHGFDFTQNCTCNSCEESCHSQGFVYSDSAVLENFNYLLVGSVWFACGSIAILVTIYKNKKQSHSNTENEKYQ